MKPDSVLLCISAGMIGSDLDTDTELDLDHMVQKKDEDDDDFYDFYG